MAGLFDNTGTNQGQAAESTSQTGTASSSGGLFSRRDEFGRPVAQRVTTAQSQEADSLFGTGGLETTTPPIAPTIRQGSIADSGVLFGDQEAQQSVSRSVVAQVQRGGIAWRRNTDYSTGDLVTYLGQAYIASVSISNSSVNPADDDLWLRLESDIQVGDETGVYVSASSIQFDSSTGYETVQDPNDATRVIVRVPLPVTPFAATGSLNTANSSVFDTIVSPIVLTVNVSSGAFTELSAASPTGSTILDMTVSWADTTPFLQSGSHSFSAQATGTNSEGVVEMSSISGGFSRFIPEFVMATQPTTFADFSGSRTPSTSVTSVGDVSFLATTTDYGSVATGSVMGFPTSFPRVAEITADADQAGIIRDYNVYRLGISTGSIASMLRS